MRFRRLLPVAFPLTVIALSVLALPTFAQEHGSETAEERSLFEQFLSSLSPGDDAEVRFPDEYWAFEAEGDELSEELEVPAAIADTPDPSLADLDPVFDRAPEDAIRPESRRETFPFEAFDYQSGTPTVHCIPARVCSVELAPGEVILGRAMGDPSRWLYQEMTAGSGAAVRALVALMPKSFGARTNLILTTDHRIYTLDLVSAEVEPETAEATPLLTARARFTYPEVWAESRSPATIEVAAPPGASSADQEPDVSPADLDFHYTVVEPRKRTRRLGWRPIAYDDGTFTYVRLPSHLASLPAIRGIDASGGPFLLNETYHREGAGSFIEIPRLVNRFEIFTGTGRDRRSATVYRNLRSHE